MHQLQQPRPPDLLGIFKVWMFHGLVCLSVSQSGQDSQVYFLLYFDADSLAKTCGNHTQSEKATYRRWR